jgi:hypothetical protein
MHEKRKEFSVWSIPPHEDARVPQFLGEADSSSDAFKFKSGMEMLGHVHVKVIANWTGKEVTQEETPSF